jgi:hypothetical protein
MRGMHIARVKLFFLFSHRGVQYPCALVKWFVRTDDAPDEDTGLWVVEPEFDVNGNRVTSVIHTDTILRGMHLLPVFGDQQMPLDFHFSMTLDSFSAYYVNKYIDYHAFEVVY